MYKSWILCLGVFMALASCSSEEKKTEQNQELPPPKEMFLDRNAEEVLDKLTSRIGELNSCSFTLHSAELAAGDTAFQPTKEFDIYFSDSNKLHLHCRAIDKEFGVWYNGNSLESYNYLDHSYDSLPAPSSTLGMITKLNEERGLKFPAADFFYPTLTDDLIQFADSIIYLGDTTILDVPLDVILAKNKETEVYIFINKNENLPGGLFIRYNETGEKYKSMFKNWQLDPKLPESMFEFSPPVDAVKEPLKKLS
ncbi:MAG: DUF2092 domain-containing protein [Crocinitomicaceae bacterium]|nr:DUF2092 domain-containing protein [Crocinitomicaceae bacterium]